MSIIKEFKQFALKGNVVDMAVGVIVGGAFGKIVSSIVADLVMPPIGMLMGGINLAYLKWTLKAAENDSVAVTVNYGNFLQTTLDFLIVSASIFVAIQIINTVRRKEEVKSLVEQKILPSKEIELLTEIRDLLKKE
jgi:large conductance mechanosensitive channel